jgi:cytoskeletal protein CcmA (bactofilin family)
MSIFRRNDSVSSPHSFGGASDSTPAPSAPQRRRVTQIAPGTKVQGQVHGSTELLVDGEVNGEINVSSAVTVGAEGVVSGPISAQLVRVSGRVTGNIQAVERVEVAPSGSLEGDIAAPRVVIAEGAFFKGRIEMRADRGRPAEAPGKTAPVSPSALSAPPVPGRQVPERTELRHERQDRGERNGRPNGRSAKVESAAEPKV